MVVSPPASACCFVQTLASKRILSAPVICATEAPTKVISSSTADAGFAVSSGCRLAVAGQLAWSAQAACCVLDCQHSQHGAGGNLHTDRYRAAAASAHGSTGHLARLICNCKPTLSLFPSASRFFLLRISPLLTLRFLLSCGCHIAVPFLIGVSSRAGVAAWGPFLGQCRQVPTGRRTRG